MKKEIGVIKTIKMKTPDAYRKVLDEEVNIDAPNIMDYIQKGINPNSRILEIGIMPGSGSLQFVEQCKKKYIGTNPKQEMIDGVKEESDQPLLYTCPLNQQPVNDQSINVVLSLLGPIGHSTSEAYRVLEPEGKFYVWKVGEEDKRELKAMFGNDNEGPRGYNMEMEKGERIMLLEEELETNGFEISETHQFFFDCYLPTKPALVHFLKTLGNRAVRAFDEQKDDDVLDEIVEQHTKPYQLNGKTESGIWFRKHEVMVVGIKK